MVIFYQITGDFVIKICRYVQINKPIYLVLQLHKKHILTNVARFRKKLLIELSKT